MRDHNKLGFPEAQREVLANAERIAQEYRDRARAADHKEARGIAVEGILRSVKIQENSIVTHKEACRKILGRHPKQRKYRLLARAEGTDLASMLAKRCADGEKSGTRGT